MAVIHAPTDLAKVDSAAEYAALVKKLRARRGKPSLNARTVKYHRRRRSGAARRIS